MAQQDVVIVAGASGFIGSALINRLAGRYALVGFDRAASGEPPPAAECVCIDLASEAAIKSAFRRVRIAYGRRIASVIHLAAYFEPVAWPGARRSPRASIWWRAKCKDGSFSH